MEIGRGSYLPIDGRACASPPFSICNSTGLARVALYPLHEEFCVFPYFDK